MTKRNQESASTSHSMIGLSEIDPNSFSRPDDCTVTHLHLDVDVDFIDRKLRGSVTIGVRKVTPSVEQLVSVRLQLCSLLSHWTFFDAA